MHGKQAEMLLQVRPARSGRAERPIVQIVAKCEWKKGVYRSD